MKLAIKCQDLIEHLTHFAQKYHLGNFISDIIQREEIKTFKDIKEAFECYKSINVKEVFNEEYIGKIVSSYGDYNGAALIQTKDRSKDVYNSPYSTLTIEGSLEEYSELILHKITEESTLAILKRENIPEDNILSFDQIDGLIRKYKIVRQREYLDKCLYLKYDILSCDYYTAVLIEKKGVKK